MSAAAERIHPVPAKRGHPHEQPRELVPPPILGWSSKQYSRPATSLQWGVRPPSRSASEWSEAWSATIKENVKQPEHCQLNNDETTLFVVNPGTRAHTLARAYIRARTHAHSRTRAHHDRTVLPGLVRYYVTPLHATRARAQHKGVLCDCRARQVSASIARGYAGSPSWSDRAQTRKI